MFQRTKNSKAPITWKPLKKRVVYWNFIPPWRTGRGDYGLIPWPLLNQHIALLPKSGRFCIAFARLRANLVTKHFLHTTALVSPVADVLRKRLRKAKGRVGHGHG